MSTFQLEALCLTFGLIFAMLAGGAIGYLATPAIDRMLGQATRTTEGLIFAGLVVITLQVLWS